MKPPALLACLLATSFAAPAAEPLTAANPALRLRATNTIAAERLSPLRLSETVVRLPASLRPDIQYRVVTVDANRNAVATNLVRADGGAAKIATDARHLQIITPDTAEATNRAVLTAARTMLPIKIGVPRTVNNQVSVSAGDLFLQALEIPLRWKSNLNAYASTLAIGLDFPEDPRLTDLPFALTFQLIAEHCSLDRPQVTINRAGPAGYQNVVLTCENPRGNPTIYAAYPNLPRKPLTVPCLLELGDLVVDAEEAGIFGFGLGTTRITVARLAKDRFDLSDASELLVTLKAGRGKLASGPTLRIAPNESVAATELRSVGLGPATVTARFGPFEDTKEIRFLFPLSLMVATVVGGALGGCGRIFRRRQQFKRRYRMILEGCVCGVLIYAAALAGIVVFNLSPAVIGTELGAFVIAAIAGYTGSTILDRMQGPAKPEPVAA